MSQQNQPLYEFGEFRLDAQKRVLRRGEKFLPLPPKVFDTLCLLVEQHGNILSKREMMDALWTDAFVEESNLSQNIYTLRRALGTDENGENFIENVPRRGYRFAAPVRILQQRQNGMPVSAVVQGYPEVEKPKLFDEINEVTQNPARDLRKIEAEYKFAKPETENETTHQSSSVSAVSRLHSLKAATFLAAGVFALLLVGFVFYKAGMISIQNEKNSVAPIETVAFQKLTFSGEIFYPILAADGKSFAYVEDGNLFVQEVDSGNVMRLNVEGAKIFGFLQFSPDGSSIYFRNQRTIDLAGNVLRVSRFGGAAKTIAENVWSGFSFSPDGKFLAFIRFYPARDSYVLIIKNLESGVERNLVERQSPNGFSYYNGSPAWSPDAKKIAIAVQNNQQTPASETAVIDVESGGIEQIKTPRFRQIEQFVWLPGGKSLAVVARENNKFFQLWQVEYPSGDARRITNDLNIYRAISLSADGKKLLARQFTTYAHIWTATDGNLESARQITSGNLNRDGVYGLKWTPDGDLIYVTRIIGDWDIWSLRPGDGSRRQLTRNSGDFNETPAITTDGKYVFFSSNRTGSKHVWRMDADGGRQTQMTFGEKEIEFNPAVSADGAWLYYLQRGGKSSAVCRKSLIDERIEQITTQEKFSPDNFLALSPDGRYLAFHNVTEKIDETAERQLLQIAVVSTESPSESKIFNLALSPVFIRWTNGGKTFDYVENAADGAKIWRQDLDETAAPRLILTLPKERIFNFAWSADGKNLALSRGRQQNDAVLLTNF